MNTAARALSLSSALLLVNCATSVAIRRQPSTVTELVAAGAGVLSELYVLDAPQRTVFRGNIFSGWLRDRTPRLQELARLDPNSSPVDISFDGTHALVLDNSGPRILLIHTNGSSEVIYAGEPLAHVTHLAVSTDHVIAVAMTLADKDSIAFVRYGRKNTPPPYIVTGLPFRRINQMRFDGNEFHVLADNLLYSTTLDFGSSQSVTPTLDKATWRRQAIPGAHDNFATANGVFYFLGTPNLSLLRDTSILVPFAVPSDINPYRVAATRTELLVASADGRIAQTPRPVPVAIYATGPARNINDTVAATVLYLSHHNLLPVQLVTPQRPFASLVDLLTDVNVLVSSDLSADSRQALASVLCGLTHCTNQVDVLNSPVAVGQTLTIPNISLTSLVSVERADLGGRTVADVIADRFPSATERQDITDDYLRRLNKELSNFSNSLNTGWVRLPVKRWHFVAFVPEADTRRANSELNALGTKFGSSFTTLQALSVTPQSCQAPAAVQTGDLAKRQDMIRQLIHAVSLPNGGANLQPIVIAEEDVDRQHPAFYYKGVSAWQKAKNAFAFEAETGDCDVNTPSVRDHIETLQDHGTHIAGIIASRGFQGVQGLLPAARLYLLSLAVAHEQDIVDAIEAAVALDLNLFNFSYDITFESQSNINRLLKVVRDNKASVLFVVAAGNTGGALKNASLAVVLAGLPNVVIVGASNDCNDVLGDIVDGSARRPGTARGAAVNLLAPGLHVPGPVAKAGIAQDSGSSQATAIVTAAAGVLMATIGEAPVAVKTRLVYTTDWLSDYQDAVSGGLLNLQRAAWQPKQNVLRIQSAPEIARAVKIDFTNEPALKIKSTSSKEDVIVPLRRVLRIEHLTGSEYRVVWASVPGNQLVVLPNVLLEIDPPPPCSSTLWNDATQTFDVSDDVCQGGFPISQVQDYVAALPVFEVVTR